MNLVPENEPYIMNAITKVALCVPHPKILSLCLCLFTQSIILYSEPLIAVTCKFIINYIGDFSELVLILGFSQNTLEPLDFSERNKAATKWRN